MAGGKKTEKLYLYRVFNCNNREEQKTIFTDKELFDSNCGGCEEPYVYNWEFDICEHFQEEAPIIREMIGVVKSNTSTAYGWGGAKFYKPLETSNFPVKELGNGDFINSDNSILPVLYTRNLFWKNTGGNNGRLNKVGVWGDVPNNEWVGFSKCLKSDKKRKINIGVGADNSFRIKINGILIVEADVNIQDTFNYWHVFEVELNQGDNVIEIFGKNFSSIASFGVEIYNTTQDVLIGLTSEMQLEQFIEFSTLDMNGNYFHLGENSGLQCKEGWYLSLCDEKAVCVFRDTKEVTPCNYGVYKFSAYPCDCWQVIGHEVTDEIDRDTLIKYGAEYVELLEEYENCKECLQDNNSCNYGERTLAYSTMVKLPEPAIPDRGFKECCYDNLVLAHLTDSKYQYNDFNSFYFKKQMQSDDCDFVLVEISTGDEYSLNDGTYGQYWDFGDFQTQPNLTVYKVEWRNVLGILGTGLYQIKKVMTVAGMQFEELSNTFHLEHFSNELADKTVRLDSVMDGKLVHLDVDFKGTGFTTSIRMQGYFGNRNPEYVQDNLVKRNYDTVQISMSQENEYQFQTNLLPVCITEEIYDFMLFGNQLYMNDYNLANHSYRYFKFPVELKGNKGSNYYPNIRDSRINLTFTDREKDKRKLNC